MFFSQYINVIALEALAWKYYICYCVFLVFEVFIIYFFIVETRYTPKEEIAKYFDGDRVDVAEIANAELKHQGTAEQVELADKNVQIHGTAKQVENVGNQLSEQVASLGRRQSYRSPFCESFDVEC